MKILKIGNKEIKGTEARGVFGLKSANFEINIEDNIKFVVKGYGHGVGLSQTGADSLAKQGKKYDEILNHLNQTLGFVIVLDIDEKILEKRITGRRICEDCKTIYNINDENKSPEVDSICDNCGGKLYQRSDDNLEAFQTRYEMYLEKTEPIINHYRKQNVLVEIDGNDTVDNIFKKVDKIINN